MARPGLRQFAVSAVAVVLLTLLTWPVRDLTPEASVDVSWQGGLHLAAVDGLRFGPDILFTHGPLGFLVAPQLWSRGTAVAAVVFAVVAQAALLAALLQALRRFLPLAAAVLVALVATRVVVRPPSETLSLAVLLVCLSLLQSRERPASLRLWCVLGVSVTALQSLVKLNSGIYCAVLLVVTVLALAERRLRTLGLCVVSGTGALLLLWVAIGQRLGDLPVWVRGSIDLTSGYTAAMAVQEPGREVDYVFAGALLALLVVLLVRYRDGARLPFVVALLLLTGFIEFKQGFVRHNRHVLGFLAFLLVLPIGLRLRPAATLPRLAVSALAVVATAVAAQGALGVYLQESATSAPRAYDQVRTLASAERSLDEQARWRGELVAAYRLDAAVLAAVGGAGVQVDPYDTAVVWAYDLAWAPVPVFQQYSTYTPDLDRTNAEALAEPGAPQVVLRARTDSIDRRATAYEAPQYALATVCRYREELLTDRWQVLRQSPDRCGPERLTQTVTLEPGRTVDVPAPSSDRAVVYARLRLPSTLTDALVQTLFKPAAPPSIRTDGTTRDLVRANAGGPLLLRVPMTGPVGPGPGDRLDVSTLALPGQDQAVDVAFYEVELAP